MPADSLSPGTSMFPVALCICMSPGPPQAPPQASPASGIVRGETARTLHEYLTRLAELGFSGAVGAAHEGNVVLLQGYGLADRATGRPVLPDTVFTVGSITKQFTGAAVLKLATRGKLRLEDPLERWFEGVEDDKRGITLHQLLTHTAGFPGALGDDFEPISREDFVREALATPLQAPPGTRYLYSNVGFSLAAAIVELASGKPYETFLREELFLPAGMHRTGITLPGFRSDDMAVGYRRDRRWGTFLERPSFVRGPSWHLRGNGGIQSTVGDMLRWAGVVEGRTMGVLTPEEIELWTHPWVDEGFGDSAYGYGWSLLDTPEGRLVTHNGGNRCFSADFRDWVDAGWVVFAASNSAEFPIDPVTESLGRIVLGKPHRLPPTVADVPSEALARWSGTWLLARDGTVEVSHEGNHLRLTTQASRAANLLEGGSGKPFAVDLVDRSLVLIEEWLGGETGGLLEALGGPQPPPGLRRALDELRNEVEQHRGPIVGLQPGYVSRGLEELRVYVALEHEAATSGLALAWEGDRLVGLEPLDAPPRASVDVFPVVEGGFQSFRLGFPASLRLEPRGEELVLRTQTAEEILHRAPLRR